MARVLTDESTISSKARALKMESGFLVTLWRIEAGLAAVLLPAGLMVLLVKGSTGVLIIGAIVAALAIGHFIKVRENEQEHRMVSIGLKGEARVSDVLQQRLPNDCYILNDVNVRHGLKSAQIDQLVVSPKGIFVIETKNWGGEISGDEGGAKWRQVKWAGKKHEKVTISVHSPIRQNQRHVEVLSRYLRTNGVDWPDIYSIVIMVSKKATWDITNRHTPVLRPAEAADYILGLNALRIYTDIEIDAVLNLFVETA